LKAVVSVIFSTECKVTDVLCTDKLNMFVHWDQFDCCCVIPLSYVNSR